MERTNKKEDNVSQGRLREYNTIQSFESKMRNDECEISLLLVLNRSLIRRRSSRTERQLHHNITNPIPTISHMKV
jgi:hypothetical protein